MAEVSVHVEDGDDCDDLRRLAQRWPKKPDPVTFATDELALRTTRDLLAQCRRETDLLLELLQPP